MIKVKIESVRVEPGNVLIGGDRVHVTTAGQTYVVQVPRGAGEAYKESLGAELQLVSAQITENDRTTDGMPKPVTADVVLDGRPDYPHDFEISFTSLNGAQAFLKRLGFQKFRHVRRKMVMRNGAPLTHKKTGEPRTALLPTEGVVL